MLIIKQLLENAIKQAEEYKSEYDYEAALDCLETAVINVLEHLKIFDLEKVRLL